MKERRVLGVLVVVAILQFICVTKLYAQNYNNETYRSFYINYVKDLSVAEKDIDEIYAKNEYVEIDKLLALVKCAKKLDEKNTVKLHVYAAKISSNKKYSAEIRLANLRAADEALRCAIDKELMNSGNIISKNSDLVGIQKYEGTISSETKNLVERYRGQLKTQIGDDAEDKNIRRYSVKMMRFVGGERERQLLAGLIGNNSIETDNDIKKEALLTLSYLNDDSVESKSVEIIDKSGDDGLKKVAIYALGHIKTDYALDKLTEYAMKSNVYSDDRPLYESSIAKHIQTIIFRMKSNDENVIMSGLSSLQFVQWNMEDRYKSEIGEILRRLNKNANGKLLNKVLGVLIHAKLDTSECVNIVNVLRDKMFTNTTEASSELKYIEDCSRWNREASYKEVGGVW